MAAEAGRPIKGTAIADVMAWASGSGHIILKLAGEGSSYEVTFLKARANKGSATFMAMTTITCARFKVPSKACVEQWTQVFL